VSRLRRGGHVLVTCLYVVAVLSVSSVALVRSASLMTASARLLDEQQTLSIDAHRALRDHDALDMTTGSVDCRGAPELSLQVQVLHERTVSRLSAEDEVVSARYRVYGVHACASGRALMETTFGVLDPAEFFDAADVPNDLSLGRLSWRRVW